MLKDLLAHLTADEISLLAYSHCHNFVPEQPDRFETVGAGNPCADEYAKGTLSWCYTAADGMLYLAAERAQGFSAMLLGDLEDPDKWIVLSSRPFATIISQAPEQSH